MSNQKLDALNIIDVKIEPYAIWSKDDSLQFPIGIRLEPGITIYNKNTKRHNESEVNDLRLSILKEVTECVMEDDNAVWDTSSYNHKLISNVQSFRQDKWSIRVTIHPAKDETLHPKGVGTIEVIKGRLSDRVRTKIDDALLDQIQEIFERHLNRKLLAQWRDEVPEDIKTVYDPI